MGFVTLKPLGVSHAEPSRHTWGKWPRGQRAFLVSLHRFLPAAAIIAISLGALVWFASARCAAAATQPATAVVTINCGRTIVAPFEGLGVQWDSFRFPPRPADWRMIVSRMDFCRPGYLRVMVDSSDYCLGFDANGAPQYVWNDGDAAERANLAHITGILDYAQSRQIPVILGEWGKPKTSLLTDPLDPRWPRIIADFVTYLRDTRGDTMVQFYNIVNEPNGSWSGITSFDEWRTIYEGVYREFHARGLDRVVTLNAPDDDVAETWSDSWAWLHRTARVMALEVGAWDLHWYASDDEVLNDRLEQDLRSERASIDQIDPPGASSLHYLSESGIVTGKVNGDQQPRVRTFEYGVLMSDYVAQVARAGWQGALAWDLDDAMHSIGWDVPDPPGPLSLKLWGFWNSQGDRMGHPEEKAPRPWFYAWSVMSRLFPRGSRIVATSAPDLPHFRAMAATHGVAGKLILSILLVNDDWAPCSITVRASGAPSARATLTCYHYFESDRPVDTAGLARPALVLHNCRLDNGVTIALPSRGAVYLTTEAPSQRY